MINKLINNFLKYGNLSQDEKDAIIQSTEIKNFRKGEFLLREGQKSVDSYFILKGCVRQYYTSNEDEITTRFFFEEDWVISVNEYSENQGSIHNWICVEDCIVIAGNEQKARQLFEKFPGLETISRKIVEKAFSEIQRSVISYHSENPEQRYLSLITNHPDILQRIQQYHIASFIGVKPESLSRIRKRVTRRRSD